MLHEEAHIIYSVSPVIFLFSSSDADMCVCEVHYVDVRVHRADVHGRSEVLV